MLALGMMIGDGRPAYRVEINANRNQWDLLNDAPQVANLGYAINLSIVIGPGVTVQSDTLGYDALAIRSLYSGSSVYLINRGVIRGYDSNTPNFTTAVYHLASGCGLFIDNSSGYIYAGYMAGSSSYGYAVRYSADSSFNWLSGSTRIAGTVYQG